MSNRSFTRPCGREEMQREAKGRPAMDNARKELKEKHIALTRIGEATRDREVCRSLVRTS